jgi:hypothetical protein
MDAAVLSRQLLTGIAGSQYTEQSHRLDASALLMQRIAS